MGKSALKESIPFRVSNSRQRDPEFLRLELAKAIGLSAGGAHYIEITHTKGIGEVRKFTMAQD